MKKRNRAAAVMALSLFLAGGTGITVLADQARDVPEMDMLTDVTDQKEENKKGDKTEDDKEQKTDNKTKSESEEQKERDERETITEQDTIQTEEIGSSVATWSTDELYDVDVAASLALENPDGEVLRYLKEHLPGKQFTVEHFQTLEQAGERDRNISGYEYLKSSIAGNGKGWCMVYGR